MISITVRDPQKELFEAVIKSIHNDCGNFTLVNQLIRFFKNKYTSKILYGLLRLEFSSYYEMLKLANTSDNRQFHRTINELRNFGIVQPLFMDSDEYETIYRFWKKMYPHSSSRPAFYRLKAEWKPQIKMVDCVLKHYADEGISEKGIDHRNNEYLKYCEKVKKNDAFAKELELNSIGKCYECNKHILKSMKEHIDYERYGRRLICSHCHKKADVESIGKWIK